MLIKYENCQLTLTFKCLFLRLTAQSASTSSSHICTIYEFHSPTDESYNSITNLCGPHPVPVHQKWEEVHGLYKTQSHSPQSQKPQKMHYSLNNLEMKACDGGLDKNLITSH